MCDNIRFIIAYKLGKELELFEFNLKSIEKDNPMITKPKWRLKFLNRITEKAQLIETFFNTKK